MMPKHDINIVLIGGGTGSFTLLQSLKKHSKNITALVNMADDGGSTGVLRDELGVLPPGDIRQCLVALSEAPEEMRELFNFRFPTGTFEGHSFGNIFLSAVESMTSDFNDAVRMASDVLRLRGQVFPVTLDNCQLSMVSTNGKTNGQYKIATETLEPHEKPELSLVPAAALNPKAKLAIEAADLIVLAPGNLYCSLAPALLANGMAKALSRSSAPKAFVCNLVNKPGHTADFTVSEYASEIERITNAKFIDYVLYNQDIPSASLLELYAVDQEYPVIIDKSALKKAKYQSIAGNFLSHTPPARNKNDSFIHRSLIRHDGDAIAKALLKLV